MPVLNITGSLSPHIEDTVTFNGRLEPTKTNWMKVALMWLIWIIYANAVEFILDQRLRTGARRAAGKIGRSI